MAEARGEIEAMGNWLEGALSALVQAETPIHSAVIRGPDASVSIHLMDGRVIYRRAGEITASRQSDAPARVYLIEAASGQIKIGIAIDVDKRLKTLQSAHGDPLKVLAEFAGGHDLEQKLHKALAAYRLKGEWFRPGPWVDALIAGAAAGEKPAQLVRRAQKAPHA